MNNMNKTEFAEGTFDELYGHIILELKENHIRTEVNISPILHQPMGLVHGGLYASMAEAAISYAAYFTTEGVWVGVNNNTDFLNSSKEGSLVCEASPIKLGKRSQIWEAKIYNGDTLCAISKVRLSNLDA